MKYKVGGSVSAKNMISNNLYLELQTTIYKYMFGETTISYVKIGNHPIETTILKWMFQVPGIGFWNKKTSPQYNIIVCWKTLNRKKNPFQRFFLRGLTKHMTFLAPKKMVKGLQSTNRNQQKEALEVKKTKIIGDNLDLPPNQ